MDWDHFEQIPKSVRREPIRGLMPNNRTLHLLAILVAILPWLVIGIVVFFSLPAHPREHYSGQYAQVDPAIRQWFRDQKIPGTQSPCCSEADGVYAEEDIRDGHYWTRFVAKQYNDGAPVVELLSGWMQVPDEAVIHNPNRHGSPVVWWGWNGNLIIRCYSPGGGV